MVQGKSAVAVVFFLACVACSSTPPPVAVTVEIARQVCSDQQPWETCFTLARDRSARDVEAIRRDEKGPVQLTMEIGVLFCEERENWRTCAEKCAAVSDKDRAAAACKQLDSKKTKWGAECPDEVPQAKP